MLSVTATRLQCKQLPCSEAVLLHHCLVAYLPGGFLALQLRATGFAAQSKPHEGISKGQDLH